MQTCCGTFFFITALAAAAQAGLDCQTTEIAGTSSGMSSETAAKQAAHRAWEKQARFTFGVSYTWLMATETGRGVHWSPQTRLWAAWVQGYPCRMLPDPPDKQRQ